MHASSMRPGPGEVLRKTNELASHLDCSRRRLQDFSHSAELPIFNQDSACRDIYSIIIGKVAGELVGEQLDSAQVGTSWW